VSTLLHHCYYNLCVPGHRGHSSSEVSNCPSLSLWRFQGAMLAWIGSPLCFTGRYRSRHGKQHECTRETCRSLGSCAATSTYDITNGHYLSPLRRRGLTYGHTTVRRATYYMGIVAGYNGRQSYSGPANPFEFVVILTASLRPVNVQTGHDIRIAAITGISVVASPLRTFDLRHLHHFAPFNRPLSHDELRAFPPFHRPSQMDM
jgi:hypothetical protein